MRYYRYYRYYQYQYYRYYRYYGSRYYGRGESCITMKDYIRSLHGWGQSCIPILYI
jgi:hypothetical protein